MSHFILLGLEIERVIFLGLYLYRHAFFYRKAKALEAVDLARVICKKPKTLRLSPEGSAPRSSIPEGPAQSQALRLPLRYHSLLPGAHML